MYSRLVAKKNRTNQRIILVSQNVVVPFNKDIIITMIKLQIIALLLMKTALFWWI